MNWLYQQFVMLGQGYTQLVWLLLGWLWWGFGVTAKCLCGYWLSRWVVKDKPETGV